MSSERLNDSTRHLSAGTYLDATYRNLLVREIYLDRTRRVAPSYGFDLPTVLIHARRALVREIACDALLVGGVVTGLLLAPASTIIAILALALWHLSNAAARLFRDYLRYYFRGGTVDEYTHLRQRLIVFRRVWKVLGVIPLLLAVGLGLAAAGRLAVPTGLSIGGLGELAPWTPAILGAELFTVIVFATAQHLSLRALRTGCTAPALVAGPRIRTIARQQADAITIYSKFRPFIGSGVELRTWSFVQRLTQASPAGQAGKHDSDFLPFRTADIVDHLRRQISSLAWDSDNETRLTGLTVTPHIFVAGTKTADLPEEIATADPIQVMADPTGHARHYLSCQVESWDGEVVTSIYVHASLQGKMLYLEFATWALPPTRREFHVMDQPGGVGIVAYLRTVGNAVRSLPLRIGGALPRLAANAIHAARAMWRGSEDYDTRCRGVDIGARVSARELGSGLDLDDEERPMATPKATYFQNRDVLKYAKVVERRLLSTVLDFLEKKGIDVSEYRQRMVAILNVGAINYGPGNVTVSGTAVGEGASVHYN